MADVKKIAALSDTWGRHDLMEATKWSSIQYLDEKDPALLDLFTTLYSRVLDRYGERDYDIYRKLSPQNMGVSCPVHLEKALQ